jgi:hypothetical protein
LKKFATLLPNNWLAKTPQQLTVDENREFLSRISSFINERFGHKENEASYPVKS